MTENLLCTLCLCQIDILLDQLIYFDILHVDLLGISGQNNLILFFSLTLDALFDRFHFAVHFVISAHCTSLCLSVLLRSCFRCASFSLNQYYYDGTNGHDHRKYL